MPTSSQNAAPVLPVSELTNVKVKTTGVDTSSSSNRLDASTLYLTTGANRVYVDGLPDQGPGGIDGATTTITCSFFSAQEISAGTDYTIDGGQYRCTEVETDYAVGELVKGTATFVQIPD